MPQNRSSASNPITIYGLHPAPVHSSVNSSAYSYGSGPPTSHSSLAFAPHNASLNQSINPNASYHPAAPSAPPPQPTLFNQYFNAHTPHTSAAASPPIPSPPITNRPEPKCYGGSDYALSWDTPTAPLPSHSPSSLSSQSQSREVDAMPLPPSYSERL
ncbi:hypothetical protein B0H17DRAFT_1198646 [Mycena rosella]|uniref:Uncharacterized protein n=1 Tax=Mycena rosella TaxID=1033263 RepID=A0AAD7DMN7_MYCRO|nr:hypothetical protein B0H17DRAFT_1198646 [Mycena rosella]